MRRMQTTREIELHLCHPSPKARQIDAAAVNALVASMVGMLVTLSAFVPRPLEYGPRGKPDLVADSAIDLPAKDFNDLAAQLGV